MDSSSGLYQFSTFSGGGGGGGGVGVVEIDVEKKKKVFFGDKKRHEVF